MKLNELELAQELAERDDYDRAYTIATKNLRDDPNSFQWMMVLQYVLLGADKPEVAYQIGKRLVQMKPQNAGAWMNLGMAARDIWQDAEALRCFKRGIRVSNNDKQKSQLMVNASSVLIDTGRFDEAEEYCHKALKLAPDSDKAVANLGFCQLAQRNWKEGWANYRKCLGHEWRPIHKYADEPQWDGKGKGTIVAYGEQGLGDQICFAEMLPDIDRWCNENDSKLIVDINPRLGNLLRRSFPNVKIYGTQGEKRLKWDKEDQHVDYSLPIGQFAEYFRRSDDDFSSRPFLKPCPDRESMWRSLFAGKKKPVIGIGWSGGIRKTGAHMRKVSLEALLPLFESIDAHWVSLQYKPCTKELDEFKRKNPHVDIEEYTHATLLQDYDNTAALVAALDAVIAVPTTVIHLAGALGVRTIAMRAPASCWKFRSGNPFHPITAMIDNNGDWNETIKETASYLEDLCLEFSSGSTPANPSPITSLNSRLSETPASQSA